jgi:hypothetical protein
MKRSINIGYSVLGLAAGVALLLVAGCGKQESSTGDAGKPGTTAVEPAPAPAPAQPASSSAQTPAAAVNEASKSVAAEAQKSADAIKASAAQAQTTAAATAQQTVDAATLKANAAASDATNQVQALIEKAKGYVTDEKYKDALGVLQQLSSVKLTDEQQKLVDSLKEKVQTALASTAGSNAASALGNILGGKK